MKTKRLIFWGILLLGFAVLLTGCAAKKCTMITTGNWHACALSEDGEVQCWGDNRSGQLGSGGTYQFSSLPVTVKGLNNVKKISASEEHTCAWTSDQAVWCWGGNFLENSNSDRNSINLVPVEIADPDKSFSAAAKNLDHTCTLSKDGGVSCFGRNYDGELGNGTTVDSVMSVQVTGLTSGVKAIADGNAFSCALTEDGRVLCWGDNHFSELGDGGSEDRNVPHPVSGLSSGVKTISAGYNFACALTKAGKVSCWGTIDDWNSSLPHLFQ
jgi:alpha-tubulin suppressor-like RCC1 family protein